jgi:hypothetical protein
MRKNVKTKVAVLSLAAGVSLFSMSFRPASNENAIVKSTAISQSAEKSPSPRPTSTSTSKILPSVLLVAAAEAVVAATAETSFTIILLDGAKSNHKMGVVENEEYVKKMIDVKEHQLDEKK